VKEAGGATVVEPFDIPGAGRMGVFSDPTGAVFSVWQAKEHWGAQLVNEPGTWSWSDLNTRDAESAKSFYGAVFGWEADTTASGHDEYSMLRMPGYGDFLERLDPGLRQRLAEQAAPAGFEDVVGWMVPMSKEQFPDDTPSHWDHVRRRRRRRNGGQGSRAGGEGLGAAIRCAARQARSSCRSARSGVHGEQVHATRIGAVRPDPFFVRRTARGAVLRAEKVVARLNSIEGERGPRRFIWVTRRKSAPNNLLVPRLDFVFLRGSMMPSNRCRADSGG
jgi:predicted enzyme related to lactoylglutathione lyase